MKNITLWDDRVMTIPDDITPCEAAGLIHMITVATSCAFTTDDLKEIFDHYQLDRLFK